MDQSLASLSDLLLEGDKNGAVSLCSDLLARGTGKEEIVLRGVERAMEALDRKCTAQQFNLLEIMLAGRAVTACMKVLFPPEAPPAAYRGTLVLASLRGDVHDLGKNIFKALCAASGYEVIDCGKDCPAEEIARQAAEANADAVGVSGLISTVVPQVKELRAAFQTAGLADVLLLAGGAALRQLTAETLNVDFVAGDAFDGLRHLNARFPPAAEESLIHSEGG